MKIDTKTIEGYDAMSAEEKLAALEQLELPDPDLSEFVPKDTANKYAAEAASLKKQLRERMSAEEAAKQQQEEEAAALRQELEALRRERTVDRSRTRLLELGWDGKLAGAAAEALASGEVDKVFDTLAKFQDEFTKKLKGELMRSTQRPPAGGADPGVTPQCFQAMSLAEKARLAEEQPEVYSQLTKGVS